MLSHNFIVERGGGERRAERTATNHAAMFFSLILMTISLSSVRIRIATHARAVCVLRFLLYRNCPDFVSNSKLHVGGHALPDHFISFVSHSNKMGFGRSKNRGPAPPPPRGTRTLAQ